MCDCIERENQKLDAFNKRLNYVGEKTPLEIKTRFVDPVVGDVRNTVAWGLRSLSERVSGLADWVDANED